MRFAAGVADDAGDAAQHHQRVPDTGQHAPGDEQPIGASHGQAEHARGHGDRADHERASQVVRDHQAGRDVGRQSGKTERAGQRAERKVVDADGPPDVRQQHRKGADRERIAEDEEAEKDDGPGQGDGVLLDWTGVIVSVRTA